MGAKLLVAECGIVFNAANGLANAYAFLTIGAAHLLAALGR